MSKQQTSAAGEEQHDQGFVVIFSIVMGVLLCLVLGIIFLVNVIANNSSEKFDPVTLEKTQQRLQPIGEVYTDASQVPAAPAPAATKERSAKEIVQNVCAACHSSGLLDAPKFGDAAEWKKRMEEAGGLDGMVDVAIQGRGSMPPRGGDAALTDEQVHAAVELMIE